MSEFIEKSKQQIKTYVGYEVPPNESSKLKNHSNSKKAQSIKIKKIQMWMLEKSWYYKKKKLASAPVVCMILCFI